MEARKRIKRGVPVNIEGPSLITLQRILVLGAHPDDIELSAGASIHKFASRETKILGKIFSWCEDATPMGWSRRSIVDEFYSAMKVLGVRELLDANFPNKQLQSVRQEILDDLYGIRRDFDPDLVIVPSSYNSHQDHRVVYEEARRAFRGKSIFGYAMPHSDYGFTPDAIYCQVSDADVAAKVKAVMCYKSQFALRRPYFDLEYLKGAMRTAGGEVGLKNCEKFENVRAII